MKNLRRFCAGTVFMLALSISALAGQTDCPAITAPAEPTLAGQMDTPLTIIESVIVSVLSLF